MNLYDELADWWPLVSPPSDYAEEAAEYLRLLRAAATKPLETVLELGSGGGNNASHLKRDFRMTLVEPSEGMRAHSIALNPECEHLLGDMRTVRLGRTFDAVFIHDAIEYMASEEDLRAALATAAEHVAPGGVALVAPDDTRETFEPGLTRRGEAGALTLRAGRATRWDGGTVEWIKELESCSKLSTPSEVDAFSRVLGDMARSKDRRYLPVMLSYLDDDAEAGDVMKVIIGMAESFGADDYVSAVIGMLGVLRGRARDWLEVIHWRIFSSDEFTRAYRVARLGHADDAVVRGFLEDFLKENPEKQERVEFVLTE
ncbi:hypothetical protein BHS09_26160 [Myxococcus xanthus]|uniref:Class I SAM-dependent methyltransferase n=1 Tax=Myxococcus xanthus TaxID=34 RepID=A0AAE6G3P5_MYXXA|nr:class I SAM-dependent methyltransferase [Myxococcus xanthus]QDE70182.1 hypothetical protein BHS09_26160 [Myxococcus xanthus]QDE77462.1 hypothetical protein BHS08_26185 [Myxococcus xanthus]